ncbi:MAG: hypothetical protein ACI9UU_002417 [Candidatus Azotimanducaceae bacterium]|jgi:hypothetical protein
MTKFNTVKKFSSGSGYSESAIRTKIFRKVWPEDEVWVRAPDDRILIDTWGFERWALGYRRRTMAATERQLRGTDGGNE